MKRMSSMTLIGRRWFNRGKGSTYHSVEIFVDGKPVHKIDYAYGYGDQWQWEGFNWLEKNGYIPDREENESGWRYCERKDIQFVYTVTDVQRKKDL